MLIPEIQALTGRMPVTQHDSSSSKNTGASFREVWQQTLENAQAKQVNLSKHAAARAEERGIEVTPELLDKLAGSVQRAQEKGATNILALDQRLAFIVNVPNSKIVTLMRQDEMKENIFTNIDGAVIL